jgi:starvation-inducible outer membrane lipoprotein
MFPSMKGISILAAVAAVMLSSCSSAPNQADPFDAAIQASLGSMAGGIMGTNKGGVQ